MRSHKKVENPTIQAEPHGKKGNLCPLAKPVVHINTVRNCEQPKKASNPAETCEQPSDNLKPRWLMRSQVGKRNPLNSCIATHLMQPKKYCDSPVTRENLMASANSQRVIETHSIKCEAKQQEENHKKPAT
jgi:hypothetical protein